MNKVINFTGKGTCIDELIQIVGLSHYEFTIHTVQGIKIKCKYITEVQICCKTKNTDGVKVELWVTSENDMYNVKKIEIERDK